MRKLIYILLIIAAVACSNTESTLVSSQVSDSDVVEWLPLFKSNDNSLHKTFELTEQIDGAVGGSLTLNRALDNGVIIDYRLQFLPGSFEGVKTINVMLDGNTFVGDYTPHGVFNKPAILSLHVKNGDLGSLESDKDLQFAYIDEAGNIEYLDYRKLRVNLQDGLIDLRNAEIPHFSRYGFTR